MLPLLHMRKAYGNWARDCRFVCWPGSSQFTNYHTFPVLSFNKSSESTQGQSSTEDSLAQAEEIVEKYELESGQSLTVKGNLSKNVGFWRSIGAPNFILTTIDNGYRLPFVSSRLAVRL